MRTYFFGLIVFTLVLMFGCNQTSTDTSITTQTNSTQETSETITDSMTIEIYDVLLEDISGEVWQTYEDVYEFQTVELPRLEEDGMVFIGWTDGENTYYNELVVNQDSTLSPIYEVASEVFQYDIVGGNITITGYTGVARYLRIPNYIEGFMVTKIDMDAFVSLDVYEIEIPNTIRNILREAFKDCPLLTKISFYGEFMGDSNYNFTEGEFYSLTEDCVIDETISDTNWTYQEGCIIVEVINVEVYEVSDELFYSYYSIVDLSLYEDFGAQIYIREEAFVNLESLETILFSERFSMFLPTMFVGTPRLTDIQFAEGNPYYQAIDGVVYTEDLTVLFHYPSSLESKTFTIPDHVVDVWNKAFYQNDYLETVVLGKNVNNIRGDAFYKTSSLKEIFVDDENSNYYSEDGVLFGTNTGDIVLIKYPSAKLGNQYTLPEDVLVIGPYAFSENQFIEELTLQEGLRVIEWGAFESSERITFLDLPASLTLIEPKAFFDSAVEAVIINRSIVVDGSLTFWNLTFGSFGFFIYVPDDSYEAYVESEFWSSYEHGIKPISEYASE